MWVESKKNTTFQQEYEEGLVFKDKIGFNAINIFKDYIYYWLSHNIINGGKAAFLKVIFIFECREL